MLGLPETINNNVRLFLHFKSGHLIQSTEQNLQCHHNCKAVQHIVKSTHSEWYTKSLMR